MADKSNVGNQQPSDGISGTDNPISNGNGWDIRGNPNIVDPASAGESGGESNSGSSAGTKRRGRPPGPGATKQTAAKKKTTDLAGLEKLLFSVHAMAATFLKVQELALSEVETKILAKAANDVAAHYDMGMTEKQEAWFALAFAVAGIYGPKIAIVASRKKKAKAEKAEQENVTIFPSRNGGFPGQ